MATCENLSRYNREVSELIILGNYLKADAKLKRFLAVCKGCDPMCPAGGFIEDDIHDITILDSPAARRSYGSHA